MVIVILVPILPSVLRGCCRADAMDLKPRVLCSGKSYVNSSYSYLERAYYVLSVVLHPGYPMAAIKGSDLNNEFKEIFV